MRAISILGARLNRAAGASGVASAFGRILILWCVVVVSGRLHAQAKQTPLDRALAEHAAAKKARHEHSDNVEVAWKFARACFDCADLDQSNRAAFAEEGIASCRAGLRVDPNCGPCRYYLGINLGQLARTRSLGALKLVNEMEEELMVAVRLDPTFDHGGPHRSIGLLYRDAPGWPISVGSEEKSRKHLERAVEISPAYPDNGIGLMEAYLEWGDKKAAREFLPILRQRLTEARRALTGERWETSWSDWDPRWDKIEKKLR